MLLVGRIMTLAADEALPAVDNFLTALLVTPPEASNTTIVMWIERGQRRARSTHSKVKEQRIAEANIFVWRDVSCFQTSSCF